MPSNAAIKSFVFFPTGLFVMSEPTAEWPSKRNTIAGLEYLQAIGQITLMYNFLEEMFCFLFCASFPASRKFAEEFFVDLNNRKRVDLFKATATFQEKDPVILGHLLFAMKCHDICTDNRNIVMHASTDDKDQDSQVVKLIERASHDVTKFNEYHLSLEEIRGVADEIAATFTFVARLFRYLKQREDEVTPNTLPDRPPQPRKLSPFQPAKEPAAE